VRATRTLLGIAGLALTGFGAWSLLGVTPAVELLALVAWLVAVVIIHDGVLVPAVSVIRVRWRRLRLARAVTAVAQCGFVVGGILTLFVVPETWAQGRKPANPTLLVGDYALRLVIVWAVIGLIVLVTALIAARRSRRRA
jgi:hypothetical protein